MYGAVLSRGHLDLEVILTLFNKFFLNLLIPAQAIIAALSPQNFMSGKIALNDNELEDARWFNINQLPTIPPDASISGQLIRSYIEGRLKL